MKGTQQISSGSYFIWCLNVSLLWSEGGESETGESFNIFDHKGKIGNPVSRIFHQQ